MQNHEDVESPAAEGDRNPLDKKLAVVREHLKAPELQSRSGWRGLRGFHYRIRRPAVEQAALLQILNEERQLSQRRARCRGVPLDVDTAGKGIGDRRPLLYLRLLTYRASDSFAQICSHSSLIRRFGRSAQPPSAGFRINRFQCRLMTSGRTSLTTAVDPSQSSSLGDGSCPKPSFQDEVIY